MVEIIYKSNFQIIETFFYTQAKYLYLFSKAFDTQMENQDMNIDPELLLKAMEESSQENLLQNQEQPINLI